MNRFTNITSLIIICILTSYLFSQSPLSNLNAPAQSKPEETSKNTQHWKTYSFRFLGLLDFGKEAYMPCWPEDNSFNYGGGGAPVTGYGFGIEFDFRPVPNMAIFFDITAHTWKFQVAEEGKRSQSFWVYEQSGYESHYTGIFDRDVYFNLNTGFARAGIKYIFPVSKQVEPWVAIGYGFASWTANFLSADKKSSYGKDTGNSFSLTYLAGIDFRIGAAEGKTPDFIISFFFDGASPLAKTEVNDLFYDGWTWENTTGEHAILPYRFGIALGF